MTKQEKIREAYGEHFESVKDYVDENGWCDLSIMPLKWKLSETTDIDIEDFTWFRPKSLAGIEDNNGWIKIESEDDLPKIDFITQYWFFDGASTWISTFTLEMKLGRVKITHYQPIIKPKPPIY
jgi:hypothetical protein